MKPGRGNIQRRQDISDDMKSSGLFQENAQAENKQTKKIKMRWHTGSTGSSGKLLKLVCQCVCVMKMSFIPQDQQAWAVPRRPAQSPAENTSTKFNKLHLSTSYYRNDTTFTYLRVKWAWKPQCDRNKKQKHSLSLSLSLFHFNGHFPGEPELAGVYWSKGWWRWRWKLVL